MMENIFSFFASDPGAVATIVSAVLALIGTIAAALIRNPEVLKTIFGSLFSTVKFLVIGGLVIALIVGGVFIAREKIDMKTNTYTGTVTVDARSSIFGAGNAPSIDPIRIKLS